MGENAARTRNVVVIIGLLLAAVAGCAGALAPDFDGGGASNADTGTVPTVGCARAKTILGACVACHSRSNAASAGGGFDMETTGWETRLVGMSTPASAPDTSLCKGSNLVFLEAQTQPARGLFLDKIKLATPPCGVQMPKLLPKLNPQDTACVEAWANSIVAGGSGQ